MKKLLFLSFAVMVMTSCYQNPSVVYVPQQTAIVQPQTGYDVIMGDNNQQMARAYYNGVEMYMELSLFNSLMNNGGWGNVYGTYNRYPSRYGGTTVINHYHNNPSVRSYSYRGNKMVAENKPRSPQNWSSKVNTASKPNTPSAFSKSSSTPYKSSGFKSSTTSKPFSSSSSSRSSSSSSRRK